MVFLMQQATIQVTIAVICYLLQQVLGHEVSVNQIMAAIMNNLFRKSIDVAISRFEAKDVTYFNVRTLRGLDSMCRSYKA